MPYEEDDLDMPQIGATEALADAAPELLDAVADLLGQHFVVDAVTARTVIVDTDGRVAVRWAAECRDTPERRLVARADLTVHGITMAEPLSMAANASEQRVNHYVDWAGVYRQLGMSVSRPVKISPVQSD